MTNQADETDARGMFSEPAPPYPNVLAFAHEHNLTMLPTAQRNPNGTFSSLWGCSECPDIFVGAHVGTIPAGYCRCGWVQRKWPRKRCEECKSPLTGPIEQEVARVLTRLRGRIVAKSNEWANEYGETDSDADYGRWDGWQNALALMDAALNSADVEAAVRP